MTDPTVTEIAADVHDLDNAVASLQRDDMASTVEQPPVELPSDVPVVPTYSVVVYPGDKWADLAAYYKTDVATLTSLNPGIDPTIDPIGGIVSEFRVPLPRRGR